MVELGGEFVKYAFILFIPFPQNHQQRAELGGEFAFIEIVNSEEYSLNTFSRESSELGEEFVKYAFIEIVFAVDVVSSASLFEEGWKLPSKLQSSLKSSPILFLGKLPRYFCQTYPIRTHLH